MAKQRRSRLDSKAISTRFGSVSVLFCCIRLFSKGTHSGAVMRFSASNFIISPSGPLCGGE